LKKKRSFLSAGNFAAASIIGFLVTETILTAGVLAFYHTTGVPNIASASLLIVGLDVIAFGIGVTVAFFLNERITFRVPNGYKAEGAKKVLVRLVRYQLVALAGNVIIVCVQLALLGEFSVSPIFGNMIGGVISFPVSYVVSIHFVWRGHELRGRA
jgi:putative flippase GtrA